MSSVLKLLEEAIAEHSPGKAMAAWARLKVAGCDADAADLLRLIRRGDFNG
jgi:hypothetical protein